MYECVCMCVIGLRGCMRACVCVCVSIYIYIYIYIYMYITLNDISIQLFKEGCCKKELFMANPVDHQSMVTSGVFFSLILPCSKTHVAL